MSINPGRSVRPGKSIFRKHENEEPRTEISIRRTLAEDLYLVLPQVDFGTQSVVLQVVINPLVSWVWLGFAVLAIGTGIALLPERSYSFALAKLPADAAAAATSGAAVLLIILLSAPPVLAQHVSNPNMGISPPLNELELQLRKEMGCTCPGCAH